MKSGSVCVALLAAVLLMGAAGVEARPICTEFGCAQTVDEDEDGMPEGVIYAGGFDHSAGGNVYVFRGWTYSYVDVEAHHDAFGEEHPVVTAYHWTVFLDENGEPSLHEAHVEADAWTLDHEKGGFTHITGVAVTLHDHDGDGRPEDVHLTLP